MSRAPVVLAPTSSGWPRVALRPVWFLQDRIPVAYEARARPPAAVPGRADVLDALLSAGHAVAPAPLLVPLSGAPDDLWYTAVAGAAARVGLPLDRVTVGLRADEVAIDPEGVAAVCRRLAADDAQVALMEVTDLASALPVLRALRPRIVMLAPSLVARLGNDVVAAEVGALLVMVTTLGGRVVADGVDGDEVEARLTELGIVLGLGSHLGPPLVTRPEDAAPGDTVVSASWPRERGVRLFEAQGTVFEPAKAHIGALSTAGEKVTDVTLASALSAAVRRLQAEHNPELILAAISDQLQHIVPADRLCIYEADHEMHRLVPRLAAGADADAMGRHSFPLETGVTGWALQRGAPYRCDDLGSHPMVTQIPGSSRSVDESLLAVPLIAGDHTIGILDIWRLGLARFDDRDLEHAALFGYIAAAAWANARLYAELEARAMTDQLTGLLNTRWLEEVGEREFAQSARSGEGIGVVLLDLDHFKAVNDSGGHAAGDQVLRDVARALRGVVRTGDAAVRLGGEEFLLLLRASDDRGALRVAEAVRDALLEVWAPTGAAGMVTASLGVAVFPEHGATLDQLVRAADAAMYVAKAQGRDRIQLAEAADRPL